MEANDARNQLVAEFCEIHRGGNQFDLTDESCHLVFARPLFSLDLFEWQIFPRPFPRDFVPYEVARLFSVAVSINGRIPPKTA